MLLIRCEKTPFLRLKKLDYMVIRSSLIWTFHKRNRSQMWTFFQMLRHFLNVIFHYISSHNLLQMLLSF